jgi:hypothetical protein
MRGGIIMGRKKWDRHEIITSRPKELARSLPKGLRGVVTGRMTLVVKVPEYPHPLADTYFKWGMENGISTGFSL